MTLDQLKVFQMVVESGGFRAASDLLHRSQPAISMAIKNLEEELNLSLFSRDQYRPKLTTEGKIFYDKSKIALGHMDSLQILGKQLSLGKETEIKIAILAVCPIPPIMQALRQLHEKYPYTQFKLDVEDLGGGLERVMDEDADLAFAPLLAWGSKIEASKCSDIEFLPVAAPQFPLIQANDPISNEELMEYPQILVADSSRHSPKMSIGVLEGGQHWTVSDFFIKKQVILSGLGWGRMPIYLIEEELKDGRLVTLNTKDNLPLAEDVFLIRRNDRPRGPIAEEMWNILKQL